MRAIIGSLLCTCSRAISSPPDGLRTLLISLRAFTGSRDCAENKSRDNVIETVIWKFKALGIHRIKSDVFNIFYIFSSSLEHAFAFVDSCYLTACRIKFQVSSCAYPDLQNFPAKTWKRFFSPFPKKRSSRGRSINSYMGAIRSYFEATDI